MKASLLISMLNFCRFLIAIAIAFNCTNSTADTRTLSANIGYVDVNAYPVLAGKIKPMRLDAIRETATHLGASGALAYRSLQINCSLNKEAYLSLIHI